MKKCLFSPECNGFYGAYYPLRRAPGKAMILMLGDDASDRLARSGVSWLQKQGIHVLAMAPAKKDYSHHNYPLERIAAAIRWLKICGHTHIGIVGASTTGMLALVAAAHLPALTLTIAVSPSDFIMEGFYQGKRDGYGEWPGDDESSVSWCGQPLPYLPYAYRHPAFAQCMQNEARYSGNLVASRCLFDESERRHPLQESERIKVEHIQGHVVCIGAEDDAMWDTCRYIRRMEESLAAHPHSCTFTALCYEYGTHFLFPQSMLKTMLPIGGSFLIGIVFRSGRRHPKACKAARMDLDRRLREILARW